MRATGSPRLDIRDAVWMIRPVMKTPGEFLAECAARLAPFERPRVGKAGCAASLAAIALAAAALASGAWGPAGGSLSWAAALRAVVLAGIATVVGLFVVYAVAETLVERSVQRRVESYLRESRLPCSTLIRAAQVRRRHLPGGARILALLKERFPGG